MEDLLQKVDEGGVSTVIIVSSDNEANSLNFRIRQINSLRLLMSTVVGGEETYNNRH